MSKPRKPTDQQPVAHPERPGYGLTAKFQVPTDPEPEQPAEDGAEL